MNIARIGPGGLACGAGLLDNPSVQLLHLDSSIRGDVSATRQLSRAVVDAWTESDPAVTVAYRDLAADAYPHFTVGTVDDAAIEELFAADALVIGVPMYNLGVPTQLKAWIDRVCVAGRTFDPQPTGMVGMLGGRRAVLVIASGGMYGDHPLGQAHAPYLRGVLEFLGIGPIDVIRAEGLDYGPDARAAALAAANAEIAALFAPA